MARQNLRALKYLPLVLAKSIMNWSIYGKANSASTEGLSLLLANTISTVRISGTGPYMAKSASKESKEINGLK